MPSVKAFAAILSALSVLIAPYQATAATFPCEEPLSPQSKKEIKQSQKLKNLTYQAMLAAGSQIYTGDQFKLWLNALSATRIRFVDQPLPALVGDLTQVGTAYSCFNSDGSTAYTFINRQQWARILNPIQSQILFHHEVAVLAGLEKTGLYYFTEKFREQLRINWLARAVFSDLACTLALVENGNTIAHQQIVIPSKSDGRILQLTGKRRRQGIYARIVGNAVHLVDINLIQGEYLLTAHRDQAVMGHDLLQDTLVEKGTAAIQNWVFQGYVPNFEGNFTRFFDVDQYVFQVSCNLKPKAKTYQL